MVSLIGCRIALSYLAFGLEQFLRTGQNFSVDCAWQEKFCGPIDFGAHDEGALSIAVNLAQTKDDLRQGICNWAIVVAFSMCTITPARLVEDLQGF